MSKSYGEHKTLGGFIRFVCEQEYGVGVWYSAHEVHKKILEKYNVNITRVMVSNHVKHVNRANGVTRPYTRKVDVDSLQRSIKALREVCHKHNLEYDVVEDILNVMKDNGGIVGTKKALNLLKAIE